MRTGDEAQLFRVYGDSLALPRRQDGIGHRQTYSQVLRAMWEERVGEVADVYNRSRGGATVTTAIDDYRVDSDYFGTGGVMIAQVGIVDCAPRPIPNIVRKGIARLPARIRALPVGFLHRNRRAILNSGFVFRYTDERRFSATYRQWLIEAANDFLCVCAVSIAPTTAEFDAHSPGWAASIRRYNAIIAESVSTVSQPHVAFVDVYGAIAAAQDIGRYVNREDGHHITADGHVLYADLIFDAARRILMAGTATR